MICAVCGKTIFPSDEQEWHTVVPKQLFSSMLPFLDVNDGAVLKNLLLDRSNSVVLHSGCLPSFVTGIDGLEKVCTTRSKKARLRYLEAQLRSLIAKAEQKGFRLQGS